MGTRETSGDDGIVLNFDCGGDYISAYVCQTYHTVSFFFFFNKFIYLFIYFGLCWVFVSVRGLSLVAARGGHSSSQCAGLSLSRPLVAEHRLQTRRLSNCGSRTQSLRGMWDLPRPGLEPMSPALAGRFSTTAPPGKPHTVSLKCVYLTVQKLYFIKVDLKTGIP